MDKFITFSHSGEEFGYFFTKNHFLLLFISLVVIIFFSMYFSRQKTKVQKIFVGVSFFVLLVLEGLRIFWRYKYLEFHGLSLDFISVTSLDFFSLSLWISLPLILIGAIIKNKKNHSVFGLNFVFNITMLAAIITLIYPEGININFDFFHCYNLMYTLERSLIVMLGLFFAFAKWISVAEFKDLWKSLLSLFVFGIICITIGFVMGEEINLFYVFNCPLFDSLGIYMAFPWHLLVIAAFLFVFQIFLYIPFNTAKRMKYKK